MHTRLLLIAPISAALTSCGKQEPEAKLTDDEELTCPVTFTHTTDPDSEIDAVYLSGDFNRWAEDDDALVEIEPGLWSITLSLPPGPAVYQLIETISWSQDSWQNPSCDAGAALIHCDADYKDPSDTSWSHVCESQTTTSCSSMVVVEDCSLPRIELLQLDIDRSAGALTASVAFVPGQDGAPAEQHSVSLDGEPLSQSWTEPVFTLSLSDLSPSRHTLRFHATDTSGREAPELYLPFWLDQPSDEAWRSGPMYFAFVDRMANGDTQNDSPEGASADITEYQGGDFAGLIDQLPYLEALGVRTLWLSNPQGNAAGAWDGDCESTATAYHAYWPDSPFEIEEHFGTSADLQALIAAAHQRGMRVIMDWVANHVHQDHPYYHDHADSWFNPEASCKDWEGSQQNWDRIPERCWFAPYLPDLDYTQPEVLDQMVEDALWWIRTYELDGLRVDAVKHMPHSLSWNLEARIRAEIEHQAVGGDEEFWTIGETFDSHERIASYISDDQGKLQLDGQFDFPLYYSIRAALATKQASMADLQETLDRSQEVYGDALMSNFLGNHDVSRFITQAAEGEVDVCVDDTTFQAAVPPSDSGPQARLRLAWTLLFSQRPVPLIYYGDEIGLPGYGDPDNRQPLWWHTGDLADGLDSVDAMAERVDSEAAQTVRHVAALAQIRREHPALWRGTSTEWWISDEVWATARFDADTGDEALIILNRSDSEQQLVNSLGFAGLSPGAGFVDALSGTHFPVDGDVLTLTVGPVSSLILVHP